MDALSPECLINNIIHFAAQLSFHHPFLTLYLLNTIFDNFYLEFTG